VFGYLKELFGGISKVVIQYSSGYCCCLFMQWSESKLYSLWSSLWTCMCN